MEEEEENYSSFSTSSAPNSPCSPANSISSSLENSYTFSHEIPYNSDSNSQPEISSYRNPSKCAKTHQPKIPIDRICSLLDPLLCHIISFLHTEDAITTSFLSKRWQHQWASLPNLTCRCRRSWKEGLRADRISVWIRFATRHNVEEIELNLYGDQDLCRLEVEHYTLPRYVFDYTLMKILRLRFCEIAPTREITWGRLKTLSISYVRLSNGLVKKILKGSPVLEHLELYKCGGISCLDVEPSSSLKKMMANDYWLLSICELKGFHSPLLKCKHLILDTCISAWDLPGIANVLQGSPDLETLVINMTCSFNSEFGFGTNFTSAHSFDETSFWTSKEVESKSWLLKLRTIKIVGFIADLREINFVLLLVQFLLKKSWSLKQIIIYIQNHNPNRWWMHSKPEDILKVEKCLRSFARSWPQK